MNIVTIDPSLKCTAVVINGVPIVYALTDVALTKTQKYAKWFEPFKGTVTYTVFDPLPKNLPYAVSEREKLSLYHTITDTILADIQHLIEPHEDTLVCIEGYSYSSATNALLDLVTFSALLRMNIMSNLKFHMIVIPPATLKRKTCELVYGFAEGKKKVCRNNDGLAGGSFKKPDMMKALLDINDGDDIPYIDILRANADAILSMKNIPKPAEDVNDALLMYKIIKKLVDNQITMDYTALENEL